ncbi:MAG: hypothetical protein ACXWMX_00600 [Candidatus Limnocylindrales bacterium]
MHPLLLAYLARERQARLLAEADARRLAAVGRGSVSDPGSRALPAALRPAARLVSNGLERAGLRALRASRELARLGRPPACPAQPRRQTG